MHHRNRGPQALLLQNEQGIAGPVVGRRHWTTGPWALRSSGPLDQWCWVGAEQWVNGSCAEGHGPWANATLGYMARAEGPSVDNSIWWSVFGAFVRNGGSVFLMSGWTNGRWGGLWGTFGKKLTKGTIPSIQNSNFSLLLGIPVFSRLHFFYKRKNCKKSKSGPPKRQKAQLFLHRWADSAYINSREMARCPL